MGTLNGNKYRYYMPDNGETAEDAREIDGRFEVAEYAAEEAAEQYHADSCDWHEGPLMFALLREDGTETRFAVTLDYAPTFTARAESGG